MSNWWVIVTVSDTFVTVDQFYNSVGDDVTPRPLLPADQKSQQPMNFFLADSRSESVSCLSQLCSYDYNNNNNYYYYYY